MLRASSFKIAKELRRRIGEEDMLEIRKERRRCERGRMESGVLEGREAEGGTGMRGLERESGGEMA